MRLGQGGDLPAREEGRIDRLGHGGGALAILAQQPFLRDFEVDDPHARVVGGEEGQGLAAQLAADVGAVPGEVAPRARRLVDVTYEALQRGLDQVRLGARTGDIGHAIQQYVESMRCSVVRDFCSHGLGKVFHDAPNILHFGQKGTGEVLAPGMFFTIEPMVNLGKYQVKLLSDGWTAVTRDKSLSAQCEHSIGVTETGYEVFTGSPQGLFKPPIQGGEVVAIPTQTTTPAPSSPLEKLWPCLCCAGERGPLRGAGRT